MRGKHLAHTIILTLGVGLYVVDGFMVAAIMPSVVEDIGGAAFYAWSAMLYTVTATLGTACGGFATATLGIRQASLIGALLLLLGNAGAAVSPTMSVLLVARAVQGLGGGLLVAQAYGMASAFYPEALRARVLTTISVAHGLGALVGPIVGGGFATIGWWRGAFWVVVSILTVLAGLMWRFLPDPETNDEATSVPLLRLALLGTAVLSVAASGQVSSLGLRLTCVASAVILVKLTLRLDAGAAIRLFPTRPFSFSHVVGTALSIVLLFGVTTAYAGVFLPLVMQVLHGVAPLWAGYFQAVLALAWTTTAVASAGLEGSSVRRAVLAGPLLVLTGVLGQSFLVIAGSLTVLAACVATTGAGMGLCFAPDEQTITPAESQAEVRVAFDQHRLVPRIDLHHPEAVGVQLSGSAAQSSCDQDRVTVRGQVVEVRDRVLLADGIKPFVVIEDRNPAHVHLSASSDSLCHARAVEAAPGFGLARKSSQASSTWETTAAIRPAGRGPHRQ